MTPTTTTLARDPEAKRFLNDRLDWNLLRTFLVSARRAASAGLRHVCT